MMWVYRRTGETVIKKAGSNLIPPLAQNQKLFLKKKERPIMNMTFSMRKLYSFAASLLVALVISGTANAQNGLPCTIEKTPQTINGQSHIRYHVKITNTTGASLASGTKIYFKLFGLDSFYKDGQQLGIATNKVVAPGVQFTLSAWTILVDPAAPFFGSQMTCQAWLRKQ
jgi:hypothetical protein